MVERLDKIRAFYNSRLYAVLITALILVGYVTKTEVAFFAVMTVLTVGGCLIAYDFRFAVMPFLATIFFVTLEHTPGVPTHSAYYATAPILPILIVLFGSIFVGFIVFAIRNRKRANPFPKRGVFISIAVWAAAVCLNGAFNPAYTVSNLAFAATFPLALVATFLLFALYVRFEDGAFDHFMFCLVLSGTLIVLQFSVLLLSGAIPVAEGGVINKDHVALGWAVHNSFAGLLTALIPACFYFAATHKHGWIYYAIGLVEFFAAVLSQSRTATLVGAGVLLLCMVVCCFFGKNRKVNRFIFLGIAIVGVAGVVLLWDKLSGVLNNFMTRGFDDNGRLELWQNGIHQFLEHPIFGAGFYDHGITAEEVLNWEINVYPYFYHNTPIQMLGTAGIVGFAAYLYHRAYTVKLFMVRPNLKKSFLAIGVLAMVLFCMLDVLFFITYPLMYYALMLLYMEKSDVKAERW